MLRRESDRFVRACFAARTARRGAVHAFRIGARRLTAAIQLTQAILAGGEWSELERPVWKLFRACGRLRDLQVVRSALRRRHCQGRSLARLMVRTAERVKRHKMRLARYLAAAQAEKTCRRLRKLAAALAVTRPEAGSHGAKSRSMRAMAGTLNRSRRDLRLACRRVRIDEPKTLHRARVAAKVCRYQLEIAPSLGVLKLRGKLPGLQRLQEGLGAITDLMLQQAELARHVRKHPGARRELGALQERIEHERRRRFDKVFAQARPVRVGAVRVREARLARPD